MVTVLDFSIQFPAARIGELERPPRKGERKRTQLILEKSYVPFLPFCASELLLNLVS